MTKYTRYTHLERYGKDETKGIENGVCFIQSKLDGTCSSVWMDKDGIKTGSRNRELTLDNDNQGFCRFIEENKSLYEPLFTLLPNAILFGEFLVPHTIKAYVKDAWKKFYVFDVALQRGEEFSLLTPEQYEPVLNSLGITYVPTVAKLENYEGSYEEFRDKVNYLIDPSIKGASPEGLVIKNYGFINQYGRNCFAKIVFEQFHEEKKAKVALESSLEVEIAEKYVTEHLVQKELAKLKSSGVVKLQPALLQTVFYVLLVEELADIVKKHKLPIIDFKALNRAVIVQVKKYASELF